MLEGVFGVLAFFLTLLVVAGCIVGIFLAFLRGRRPRAWKIARLCLGWLGAYLAILLFASFTSQPRSIPLGQERCFDEMCYSVQAVSRASQLATPAGPLAAQGEYLVLTLQLRSAAKRSAQRPSEPVLFILAADGQRFPQILDAESGQVLTVQQVWDQPVQPGEALSRRVAFDLPAGMPKPGLVMSEGLGSISALVIGDENSPFHARTVFSLTH